jgi:hypothetical protein
MYLLALAFGMKKRHQKVGRLPFSRGFGFEMSTISFDSYARCIDERARRGRDQTLMFFLALSLWCSLSKVIRGNPNPNNQ